MKRVDKWIRAKRRYFHSLANKNKRKKLKWLREWHKLSFQFHKGEE